MTVVWTVPPVISRCSQHLRNSLFYWHAICNIYFGHKYMIQIAVSVYNVTSNFLVSGVNIISPWATRDHPAATAEIPWWPHVSTISCCQHLNDFPHYRELQSHRAIILFFKQRWSRSLFARQKNSGNVVLLVMVGRHGISGSFCNTDPMILQFWEFHLTYWHNCGSSGRKT